MKKYLFLLLIIQACTNYDPKVLSEKEYLAYGNKLVKDIVTGPTADAEQIGIELAQKLRKQGAQEILDEILAEIDRS